MYDELQPDEGAARPRRTPDAGRPFADREVPIGPARGALSAELHAWLDGEGTEGNARRGERGSDVDFWLALDAQLTQRRRLCAPTGLASRIMAAIRMELPG